MKVILSLNCNVLSRRLVACINMMYLKKLKVEPETWILCIGFKALALSWPGTL